MELDNNWRGRAIRIVVGIMALVLLAGGASAYPAAMIESAPSSGTINMPFYITLKVKNIGQATGESGWLDVSFPDNPTLSIDSYDQLWKYCNLYPQGALIWHKTNGQISALYPLVSCERSSWGSYEYSWVKIKVTPSSTGNLNVNYRGTIGTSIDPSSSTYTDQQGWPVYRTNIPIASSQAYYHIKVINNDPEGFDYVWFDVDNNHNWDPNSYNKFISIGGGATIGSTDQQITPGTHTIYMMWKDNDVSGWQHQQQAVTLNAGDSKEVTFTIPRIDPPSTSITYRVHNIQSLPSLPGAAGSINVKVYDGNNFVTEQNKNFNGGESYLDFSFNLNSGKTYRFKTYQTPSIGLKITEYWGYQDVTVSPTVSSSVTVDFYRNTPYVYSVPTYSQLTVGQSVTPNVTLKNTGSDSYTAEAMLIIDQSQSSPYDYDKTSSSATVSSGSTTNYPLPSFSPSSTGSYYFYAVAYAYVDGAYVPTDQVVWPKYADVVQPQVGNLKVYVKDRNGNTRNDASVIYYPWDWSTSYSQITSSGFAYWSNINTAQYHLEAHGSNGAFWGGSDVTVTASATAEKTIQQFMPYVTSVQTKDANGNIKTTFSPGDKVHVDVTVKNGAAWDYGSVKATLYIDQDKSSPYAFEETHGPITISANGNGYFGFDYAIPNTATGTFYLKIKVDTLLQNYVKTDDTDWSWNFNTKPLPSKGNGAWLYGTNIEYINAISSYNSVSNNKITYLFPYAGSLNLNNLDISYDATVTNYYRYQLPQLHVYPTIDSAINLAGYSWDGQVRQPLTQSQIEILANNIATKINSDTNADGLHLDIEPYDDSLITLVKEIRKKTNKPISVAIEKSDPPSELFLNTDFVVLMNYDIGTAPTPLEQYKSSATQRSNTFLSIAKSSNGYGMIGVPAIATNHEWEYKKSKTTGEITYSGYTMAEYLSAAINGKDTALNNFGESNYLGISIWGFLSSPGGTLDYEVYPYKISDAAWNILKGFGSISVSVKYPTGYSITSGSVWLYNSNYQPIKEQTLGSNGQTTFSNLNPGTYILEAYSDGMFIGSKSGVSVTNGQTTSINITTNYEGYLQVEVYHSDGSTPLSGAVVTVYNQNGKSLRSGTTDSTGLTWFSTSDKAYLWPNTKNGEYYTIKVTQNNAEVGSKTPVNVVAQTTNIATVTTNVALQLPSGQITKVASSNQYSSLEPIKFVVYVKNTGNVAENYKINLEIYKNNLQISTTNDALYLQPNSEQFLQFYLTNPGIGNYQTKIKLQNTTGKIYDITYTSFSIIDSNAIKLLEGSAEGLKKVSFEEFDQMADIFTDKFTTVIWGAGWEAFNLAVSEILIQKLFDSKTIHYGGATDADYIDASKEVSHYLIDFEPLAKNIVNLNDWKKNVWQNIRYGGVLNSETTKVSLRNKQFLDIYTGKNFIFTENMRQRFSMGESVIRNTVESRPFFVLSFDAKIFKVDYPVTLNEEAKLFDTINENKNTIGPIILIGLTLFAVVFLVLSGVTLVGLIGTIAWVIPQISTIISVVSSTILAVLAGLVILIGVTTGQIAPYVSITHDQTLNTIENIISDQQSQSIYISSLSTQSTKLGKQPEISYTLHNNGSQETRLIAEAAVVSPDGRIIDIIQQKPTISASSTKTITESIKLPQQPGEYKIVAMVHSGDIATSVMQQSLNITKPSLNLNISTNKLYYSPNETVYITANFTNNEASNTSEFTYAIEVINTTSFSVGNMNLDPNSYKEKTLTFSTGKEGTYTARASLLAGLTVIAQKTVGFSIGSGTGISVNTIHQDIYNPNTDVVFYANVKNIGTLDYNGSINVTTYDQLADFKVVYSSLIQVALSAGQNIMNTSILALPAQIAKPGVYYTIIRSGNYSEVIDFTVRAEGTIFALENTDKLLYRIGDTVSINISVNDVTFNPTPANVSIYISSPNRELISPHIDGLNGRYFASFTPALNGTYSLMAIANKDNFRSYEDKTFFIVGERSAINATIPSKIYINETLRFNVTNEFGIPIESAFVTISRLGFNSSGTTNKEGISEFILTSLEPGVVNITLEKGSYIGLEGSTTLIPKPSTTVGTDTIGVYRNSTGTFFLRNSNSAGASDIAFQFGPGGLTPIKGDYDGNGNDTAGMYNAGTGTFYLRNSNSAGAADATVQYGPGGSDFLPVVGDWNGYKTDCIGLYQKSTGIFFLKNSNSAGAADITVQYGPGGSDFLPVVGDWDGNGNATIGIYQKSTGTFFLRNSNSAGAADITVQYGPGGSDFLPVVGDWNGDRTATIGIYQISTGIFFLKNSNSAGSADITVQFGPGGSEFLPVVGNWDGQ